MERTKVTRKYLLCQKLIILNGHETREVKITYFGRNKFVKITNIILVSESNCFRGGFKNKQTYFWAFGPN